MKRGLLLVGLLLSIGFNMGLVASLWLGADGDGRVAAPAAVEESDGSPSVALETERSQPAPAEDMPVAASPQQTSREQELEPAPPLATPLASEPAAESSTPERPPAPEQAGPPPHRSPPGLPQVIERLGLEGPRRARFVRLHQRLSRHVRESLQRIQRGRRELYREMAAPSPDRQRIDELLRGLARSNAEIDRAFVATALGARELLDERQEQLYLRFLGRHMQAAAAARSRAATPPGGPRPFEAAKRPGGF